MHKPTQPEGPGQASFQLVRDGAHLFLAHPLAFPDQAIISAQVWEPAQRAMLRQMAHGAMRPDQGYVFIDVGAYAGSYTLDAAQDPRCARVIAFEPDLRNRRHLHANLFINGLSDRVEVRAQAVSQLNATATIHKSTEHPTGNRGGCGIIDPAAFPASVAQTVETVTLDEAVPLHGEVVVIKIDVEGHEREVVNGMRRMLENNRCIVQVEILIEDHTANVDGIMTHHGYRLAHREAGESFYAKANPAPL